MEPRKRPGEGYIAFIGNYLPRQCGIATFTTDLCEAVAEEAAGADSIAVAMNDLPEGYDYPDRVRFEVAQNSLNEYRNTADFLSVNQVQGTCVQHEYGISSMVERVSMRSSFARVVCVATVLSAAGPGLALAAGPGLGDDGYHYDLFRDGAHDLNYVEWWYFNLVDHSSGLELVFTYSILDPENLTGIGSTGLLAGAFTREGNLQASEFLPADRFLGSPESANLLVGDLGAVEVLDETSYRVTGAIADVHEISWDLTYVAEAPPWLGGEGERVGLLPWERMSWLVHMPAALVSGEVTINGTSHVLTGARGYHDHNWGEWILTSVIWNWGQYSEPGFHLEVGDFRRRPVGVVSAGVDDERAVFEKDEYTVLHTRWSHDTGTRQWYPTETWLLARNERFALYAVIQSAGTQALLPPPHIPFVLVRPVVFEQTARYSGTLWVRDEEGGWRLERTFAGPGFKEYAARTLAGPPGIGDSFR